MQRPGARTARELLTRYATLRIAHAERATERTARGLEEVGRALCALTGAADLDAAVAEADAVLAADRARRGAARRDPGGGDALSLAV
ncbi:DUF5133 domain-containing protein [Streptomyces fructofermentans]|uniref:DUF5133 domain-containing protein n=1 Tax=Streptomyces fructofermentans TaxID=152141 RepID=UPI0016785B28|nr:DUF5133 domain-containing protein [Streptomyces fructofermentans]